MYELMQQNMQFMQQQAEEQRKREEKQAEEQRKLMELIILGKSQSQNVSEEDKYYSMIESLKEETNEKMEKLMEAIKTSGSGSVTTNNGTYFEAQTQNNLLNNLNLNFNNVISMEEFLHNMEHVNKIPKSDLEAIAYASENMGESELAETIHRTIQKNCIEQTKGKINPSDGKELLPVMPVVCTDGSCRSHKEKVDKFWETVYDDKHFDHMLNIIDKRLYEVLQKKIYLEEYGKRKLFRKIKRKNTIHDFKKFQDKINNNEKKFKAI